MKTTQDTLNKDLTVTQLATMLGISRVAVHKKIKNGDISANKIGNIYIIPKEYVAEIYGITLNAKLKNKIKKAVHKAVQDYGEVLIRLGKE